MERKSYHHGALRASLIEAGLRLLAERAADNLSLREVAREVGVSATAVYRHFPDKDALMAALAAAGLAQLAAAQHAAADAAGNRAAAFSATGRAYVRFALANPSLFRLIFSSGQSNALSSDASAAPEAMTFLRANAAALAPTGASPSEVQAIALRAWAIAHGLAMLMLDGQAPADDALIDQVMDAGARC